MRRRLRQGHELAEAALAHTLGDKVAPPYPRPICGDRHSHRMEAHAEEILSLIDKTPDITLMGIVAHLEATHGLRVAHSSVRRLLDRNGLTFCGDGG